MDVLNLVWHSETPLTASEIVKLDATLSIHTVQAALRDLLKKGYIEVADIVYSGTVLCRNYRATPKSKERTVNHLASQLKKLTMNIPPSMLLSALLDCGDDNERLIDEMESIIREKKKHIEE
jgi:Penicillinase repressor.